MSGLLLSHPEKQRQASVAYNGSAVVVTVATTKTGRGRKTVHPVADASREWEITESVVDQMIRQGWQLEGSDPNCAWQPTMVKAYVHTTCWEVIQKAADVLWPHSQQPIVQPTDATFVPIGAGTFHARKLTGGFEMLATVWLPAMHTESEAIERARQVAFVGLLPSEHGIVITADGLRYGVGDWLRQRTHGLPIPFGDPLAQAGILPSNPLHQPSAFTTPRATTSYVIAL